MPTTRRIVCLANSRKLSGRCVAGREIEGGTAGSWIRPVSSRPDEEVSEYERQYKDGSDPRVLDVIDVPLLKPRPRGYHSENWLLDPEYYWSRVRRLEATELADYLDPVGPLWIDGASTYHGANDKILIEDAETLDSSLVLIRVLALQLRVFVPGAAFGEHKRHVQARFDHAGVTYRLRVTDPEVERRFLAEPDGDYRLGSSYLTISISEPFQGHVYKLVAAIIEAG